MVAHLQTFRIIQGLKLLMLLCLLLLQLGCNKQQASHHISRGDKFHRQGNLAKAVSEYRRAIVLDGNNVELRVRLGNVYINRSEFKKAIRQFNEAIKREPGHIAAHMSLANTYIRMKKYDDARIAYEDLLNLVNGVPQYAQEEEFAEKMIKQLDAG